MIFTSKVDLWILVLFVIITLTTLSYSYTYYKKSDLSLMQIIFYLILPVIFMSSQVSANTTTVSCSDSRIS